MAAKTSDASLKIALDKQVESLKEKRRHLGETYKNEDKVSIRIAPMYKPYFGRTMPVSINGVSIFVPIDGQMYTVPESFASVIEERISRIDTHVRQRTQLANAGENFERYAGEKGLLLKA